MEFTNRIGEYFQHEAEPTRPNRTATLSSLAKIDRAKQDHVPPQL